MGGDHDLVGREVAQRVLERRVGLVVIAHISARPEPGGRHRRERGIEALAGIIERLVNVGRPMLERPRAPILSARGADHRRRGRRYSTAGRDTNADSSRPCLLARRRRVRFRATQPRSGAERRPPVTAGSRRRCRPERDN